MISISEYMESYRYQLDYLDKISTTQVDDSATIKEIIRRVRKDFFRTFSEYIFMYFCDFDECYGHQEDSELFTFESNKKAIRRFDRYYYVVDVKYFSKCVIRTGLPEDYLLHITPPIGEKYPEYIIANYLIKKGF